MGALRRVNLISVLNLSTLNRKQTLINVLKDLAYVCPVKGFRRDIVTCFTNGIFPPFIAGRAPLSQRT
jgi:hypothetical protein